MAGSWKLEAGFLLPGEKKAVSLPSAKGGDERSKGGETAKFVNINLKNSRMSYA